jgi:hypothetical protein
MRIRPSEVDAYPDVVVELLERYGVALIQPGIGERAEVVEDDAGRLSFELIGELPSTSGVTARVELREQLSPRHDGLYETSRYEYELVDPEGEQRRAFHMHDPDWFARELYVLVHEHCERPLGHVECDHYAGAPVKDSYAGVVRLIAAWTAGQIDCSSLDCLD